MGPRARQSSATSREPMTTFTVERRTPRTAGEVDTYLTNLERLRASDPPTAIRSALSYLGANAPGWTHDRQVRLRNAIVESLDSDGLALVVEHMANSVRTDVLDACELVVRSALPRREREVMEKLKSRDTLPVARAQLLAALARAKPEVASETVAPYLSAPDPELRVAAAALAGELELTDLKVKLVDRKAHEKDPAALAAIEEALEAL